MIKQHVLSRLPRLFVHLSLHICHMINTRRDIVRTHHCPVGLVLSNERFISFHPGWNFRVELGIYYVFLQDWFSQFPREQILVLRLEDLSSKPNQIMKMVFQFLGVSLKGWKMPTKTNANRNPNKIGPMKNETKILLTKFYAEFNERLVHLLGDSRFYWFK